MAAVETVLPQFLHSLRNIDASPASLAPTAIEQTGRRVHDTLMRVASDLRLRKYGREAEALEVVRHKVFTSAAYGGLGLSLDSSFSDADLDETVFLIEAWLGSLNAQDKARDFSSVLKAPHPGTKPMTLAQKIFAQHTLGDMPATGLSAGDVVRVGLDWIIASELSWSAMARTYEQIRSPGIFRSDRLWISGDHVVHPAIYNAPKIKAFMDSSAKAKRDFKMTENQGNNYTIMHTEFARERAQPGMLVIGSDSHTCSAGSVSSLSIGLGTADVMMACALGETWFRIPESIFINFVGAPSEGISGKDVILYILQQLKRNTVAAERIVEFGGDGAKYLSCDARFAICNMATEFGAVSGVFVPDNITAEYIGRRKMKLHKSETTYMSPDADAHYAGRYDIDLRKVEPSIAVYPNPDDVVPVSKMAGLKLDGVFIGACTTTEEELVLAALVLKAGLRKGLSPPRGKRHYVPGSLPIVERLRELDLLSVYEEAGFSRGPPGCSYCVGLSAEKASEGETWLSSQNRNFQNRMGKGSIGHVTSAVVCAASSFSMSITDPAQLLESLDWSAWESYKGLTDTSPKPLDYVEPDLSAAMLRGKTGDHNGESEAPSSLDHAISSRVVRLEDFIDTDALAPGSTLTTCITDEDFGRHVLEHTHPNFRDKVKDGQQVVVAGKAFGVGSSREVAVSALKGAGVKAVIAKSFAFIYQRNQPSLGLLGFAIDDDAFYEAAAENEAITIDIAQRSVRVAGKDFRFQLSEIELNLTLNHGVAESYLKFGKEIWASMTTQSRRGVRLLPIERAEPAIADARLSW